MGKVLMVGKLSAYQIWKKVQNEKLSKSEYKKLLIENGILIEKNHETKIKR